MASVVQLTPEQAEALAEQIMGIFDWLEVTKLLGVAAATILIYDIISTLDSEVKYVWRSKWTFGRVMFHINRIWAVVLLGVYIPTLFIHGLSRQVSRCIVVSLFYVYGSMLVMGIVTSVLVVRVWLIYGKGWWFLAGIITTWVVITIPSLAIMQTSLLKVQHIPNPAPELISACIFTPNKWAFLPYITGLVYETLIFGLTVYKTWQLSRKRLATPLMARLLRDGSSYYVLVFLATLFSCVGALHPKIAGAAIGSGSLAAIMSCMCSRLILSTRSFSDEIRKSNTTACELNTLSQPGRDQRPSRDSKLGSARPSIQAPRNQYRPQLRMTIEEESGWSLEEVPLEEQISTPRLDETKSRTYWSDRGGFTYDTPTTPGRWV